ncbi:ribonuclease M5 [Paenibacillus sp. NFR01]|uniref:ribonuclease M5 n=1 Tax=Paenibacillus sp. NFR01 TaxID=1566279 RepID=UPI0008B03499|nr:ribonuclease M5 [Paenibacillus sp. NFR01]SEU31560.1 ribonuclease M5 [Paenibacillus sp. NFR01]
MIKELIVVEGKCDTVAVKRAVDADTIETGGSAVDRKVIAKIALAMERRGVIILTDPDHAGERIRKIVSAKVPGCKHAFIPEKDATRKGDIGVENASPEAIRQALMHVHTADEAAPPQIGLDSLMASGMLVHPRAAERRMELGNLLGIGYCNGKQLFKRLAMFRITPEEFAEAVKQIDQGGSNA